MKWRSLERLVVMDSGPAPSACPGMTSSTDPQDDKFRFVVLAALDHLESIRRLERIRSFLHHDQRIVGEPAAVARRDERLLGQAFSIGRIEKRQRERLDRMRGA